MVYDIFAQFYDSLMRDVEYSQIADFVLEAFERYGKKPELMLDVGCGTGSLTVELAKRGVSMIGADISEQMLGQAMEKKFDSGCEDILLLNQSMQELDLYGTIDSAVCCLDSINHITDSQQLQKGFDRVSFFMEKDGLFIFDANTEHKHRDILGDNCFVYETDDVFCSWQNEYDADGKSVGITLDFFYKINEDDTGYMRSTEEFKERAYSRAQLTEMLDKAGFETVAVFDGYSFAESNDSTEREVYIARKREQTNGKAD